ncbi:MAG: peptidase T [Synergistaceae bacterium]|jgi:tripeptide aminopeptidase|nr:peptidase T [Synergistaceae bacterium]
MYSTLDRFLKYVTFDTQSAEDAPCVPSTPGQFELARYLEGELAQLGLKDVKLSENAYVTATLPGNTKKSVPSVGFIAHLDTAMELTGKGVAPHVVEKYDGGDIVLNESEGIVLSPRDFPFMEECRGLDLVVTDGNTLLGADNKAGIAEIVGAVDFMLQHPEFEHGDVKMAFTPDEEVGHGASLLDIESFGADFAYTLDGGPIGEACYENFNAAGATVHIKGRAVHPGKAKGLMLNAVVMGQELNSLFPADETPASTEGYEGYYHCLEFHGITEEATLKYIIRDHDSSKFEARKGFMRRAVRWMQDKYGEDRFSLSMKDQYFNMAEKLKGNMHIVDTMLDAMRELGIEPKIIPMRGGTDGSALSWRGLLTPNLFTGGYNYHGRFEFIPVQSMERATDMVLKILELNVRRAG